MYQWATLLLLLDGSQVSHARDSQPSYLGNGVHCNLLASGYAGILTKSSVLGSGTAGPTKNTLLWLQLSSAHIRVTRLFGK